MTILIDASAIVAIVTGEPEARDLGLAILDDRSRLCCASGLWETTLAIARKRRVPIRDAWAAVEQFLADFAVAVAVFGKEEARAAIEAHDRYGKGTGHPARLNMGDCLAYACAKTNDARLLYKGDDFSKTDLA